MSAKLILLLMLAFLAGGCLEKFQENVPVLSAKVTMGEEVNGRMVIKSVEAYAVEMPRNKAPMDYQFPEKFPAVYVHIIQNTTKIGYQTGVSYHGPGDYGYTIGIQQVLNKSAPVVVFVEAVDENATTVDAQGMRFNWSTEIQSKTFK